MPFLCILGFINACHLNFDAGDLLLAVNQGESSSSEESESEETTNECTTFIL